MTLPSAPYETMTVTARDGVSLHAEIHGNRSAPVTVVFCHGYTLDSRSWQAQCPALGGSARLVLWDHRGHGRSEIGPYEHLTMDQLAQDLLDVIEQAAPHGPVVLVGHSMGGMSILALADQRPEIFSSRVTAVALVTTSAGPMHVDLDLPARASAVVSWLGLRTVSWCVRGRIDPGIHVLRKLAWLLAQLPQFSRVSTELLMRLEASLKSMPVQVIGRLLPEVLRFNKQSALRNLRGTPILVVAAENDWIVSAEHSRAIADLLPSARLVVIPNAGHTVIVDRPDQVNDHLSSLLCEVSAAGRNAA